MKAFHQRFGGTDDARLAQLHAAVLDPDIHLIIALRGGYGIFYGATPLLSETRQGFSVTTPFHELVILSVTVIRLSHCCGLRWNTRRNWRSSSKSRATRQWRRDA